MIANPCTADLVPGIFGTSEGFLARVHDSHAALFTPSTLEEKAGASCGYLLWCPKYHNTIAHEESEVKFSLVGWAGAESWSVPKNLAGNAFGSQESFDGSFFYGTAARFPDPAAKLIGPENAIVADARTVSACMKMSYYGKMSDASGQVAFIHNIPARELIGGNNGLPLTVDDLFRLSSTTQRLGVDTFEIAYRSHEPTAATFHDTGDACYAFPTANNAPTTQDISAEIAGPHVFGFAWRGLSAPSPLEFNLYKNLEWRPSGTSGFTAMIPRTINSTNVIAEVHKKLDATHPSWANRVLDSASTLASEVVKIAATGIGNQLRTGALKYAEEIFV